MTLPGVSVKNLTTPPARSVPTDTGVAYLTGLFGKGPAGADVDAVTGVCTSLADFIALRGGRQTYSVDYDWVDDYFREGGSRLYTSRVVGPAAVKAFVNLTGTGTTLVVTANDPGDFANGATGGYSVDVINGASGSGFRIIVLKFGGVEVARTLEANDRANLVGVLGGVTVTLGGGSGLPNTVAGSNLASGTDDRASITTTQIQAAANRFPQDLGPGQLAAPNWTSSAVHLALGAAASANNRVACCDFPDTTVKSTLLTSAAALKGTTDSSRLIALAPWLQIPGLATGGTGRTIPPSALFCARAAVIDARFGANQAPAGNYGRARYATSVTAAFSRVPDPTTGVVDAEDLNNAGVNLVTITDGAVEINGNRTQVDPTGAEANWIQVGNSRYRMSLTARFKQVGKPYRFRRVTKSTLDAIKMDTDGLLLRDYSNGDLFGDLTDDRPATAFYTDVDNVNNATSIQAGTLNVGVAVRPTRGAEMVVFTLTAVGLTEPVA